MEAQWKIGTLTIFDRDANSNDLIDDPGAPGVATYSYDPASPQGLRRAGGQNRRIRKVVAGDITYDYYYNESWQVLEVQKAGRTNKTYQQSVWGIQYVDAPVAQFRDTADDGTLDETLYYTYDGNFNVTALVGTNGTVAERYTYDPYGKVTFKAADWSDAASQAKSAYDNEILYCGYRFDPESGNYIARRRYLTPPLGRWLTPDPIGYGDGMNLYQYARSRPTVDTDPRGLQSALSIPIAAAEMAACGATAADIAAAFHCSLEVAAEIVLAVATAKAVDEMVKNAQKNAKGSDLCEKAKDALRQVEKSLAALNKFIEEHKGKIADPAKYMTRDNPSDPAMVARAIVDWQKQIEKAQKGIQVATKATETLRKAVDAACWCWYNPLTWF